MYIDTSSTTTDMVMLALIRMSSMKDGSGVIIARTIPRTAIGMATSFQFTPFKMVAEPPAEGCRATLRAPDEEGAGAPFAAAAATPVICAAGVMRDVLWGS